MAARIAGFVSRADAGLRSPRSRSRRVWPDQGGVAVHYGGAGKPPSSHAGCVATWRGWQSYHMNTHGWVDIAYNFGFCNHGYVFAGRGMGVRSAANGTNDANSRFLAAVWIGGGSYTPTRQALDALEWIIAEVRTKGDGGSSVRPHRYFKSTTCCGDYLSDVTARYHRQAITREDEDMGLSTEDRKWIAEQFHSHRGWLGPKFDAVMKQLGLMPRHIFAHRDSFKPRPGSDVSPQFREFVEGTNAHAAAAHYGVRDLLDADRGDAEAVAQAILDALGPDLAPRVAEALTVVAKDAEGQR